jgi:hypothetical protein
MLEVHYSFYISFKFCNVKTFQLSSNNPKKKSKLFFLKFIINFIILKHLTILEESKTEIIITLFKYLLNFIILKPSKYD